MNLRPLERIVGRKVYRTQGARVLAHDAWWDGHNWERRGRNTWLLRTPNGAYFSQTQSQWQGEQDAIHPLSQDEAIMLYEQMPEQEVAFEEAFPGVKIEEA